VDGVLADTRHRLHLIARPPKDWEAFFAAAGQDPLLAEGVAVAHRLAEDHEVVYLTGRPERWRESTETWLTGHGLPPGPVRMRRDNDRRPARQMKLSVVRRLAEHTHVAVIVDDDTAVVRALRGAGFEVLHAEWMGDQPALFDAQERDGAS
jgi:hypothetical protein